MPRVDEDRSTVDHVDAETLLDASKVISAVVAHSLASVEEKVSVPGLRVLVMVRSHGPLNMSAVAQALGVNASSASRTCERLVTAGLLDRRDAANDRRRVSLTLTPKGRRFVDGVMEERRAVLLQVVEAMPPRAQRSLLAGLKAFVAAAAALGDQPHLDDSTGPLLRWIV
jgi:DNA-binding MarR family transcriptional regulator